MLSQTVEYALRAVVYLALDPRTPRTNQQVAEYTQVPAGYLSKVLQALGRADLVSAQRGLHGGFTLAREPKTITVLEVVNAVDPISRIDGCPLGLKSHGPELCPLHQKLDEALQVLAQSFANCTMSELIDNPHANTPLCELTAGKTRKSSKRSKRH